MTHDSRPVARAVAIGLGLLSCAVAIPAQTIYRCGNEYTRIPCPGGRALETSDTRSAAQRAEAHALLIQERRQAAEMEATRRRDQAAIKPLAAGSLSPVRSAEAPTVAASSPKKPSAKKRPRKAASDEDFVAGVPAAPKPKPKKVTPP